jgi:hypothetical protein
VETIAYAKDDRPRCESAVGKVSSALAFQHDLCRLLKWHAQVFVAIAG